MPTTREAAGITRTGSKIPVRLDVSRLQDNLMYSLRPGYITTSKLTPRLSEHTLRDSAAHLQRRSQEPDHPIWSIEQVLGAEESLGGSQPAESTRALVERTDSGSLQFFRPILAATSAVE